jgi:hypothetical protein
MEVYQNYKGYGIKYISIYGTTIVDYCGFTLEIFKNKGEELGLKLAKEFIDDSIKNLEIEQFKNMTTLKLSKEFNLKCDYNHKHENIKNFYREYSFICFDETTKQFSKPIRISVGNTSSSTSVVVRCLKDGEMFVASEKVSGYGYDREYSALYSALFKLGIGEHIKDDGNKTKLLEKIIEVFQLNNCYINQTN